MTANTPQQTLMFDYAAPLPIPQLCGQARKAKAHDIFERVRADLLLMARRALLQQLLSGAATVTVEDIRPLITVPPGINPTFFGPTARPLVRLKIIKDCDSAPCKRPEAHARPTTVYRLIDPQAAAQWLLDHGDAAGGGA